MNAPDDAAPSASQAAYDEVPYPRLVHSWSHPRATGAMALLFGIDAAPVESARVLDLGCASGTAAISLAADYPELQATGVDLSPRQIAEGQALVEELALPNARLLVGTIDDLPSELGAFDYIICHGVFSWVGPDVQDAILAACARLLAPQGVAYISYNAFPGWHLAGLVRELFLRRTDPAAPPLVRVAAARGLLDDHLSAAEMGSLRRALLLAEKDFLDGASDAYLFHEYFAPEHQPLYIADFVARARAQGLDYVADARPDKVLPTTLPTNVATGLRQATDRVDQQQLIDHHTSARFRRSLLCHAAIRPDLSLDPARLARLHVSLARDRSVTREGPMTIVTNRDGRSLHIADPTMAEILGELRGRSPASTPMSDLIPLEGPEARALSGQLVGLFFAEVVELTLAPVRAASLLPTRPAVSALNRAQAARGWPVTSQVFFSQRLDDLGLRLTPLLDGRRTIPELAEALGEAPQDIEGILRIFLDRGLLLPE